MSSFYQGYSLTNNAIIERRMAGIERDIRTLKQLMSRTAKEPISTRRITSDIIRAAARETVHIETITPPITNASGSEIAPYPTVSAAVSDTSAKEIPLFVNKTLEIASGTYTEGSIVIPADASNFGLIGASAPINGQLTHFPATSVIVTSGATKIFIKDIHFDGNISLPMGAGVEIRMDNVRADDGITVTGGGGYLELNNCQIGVYESSNTTPSTAVFAINGSDTNLIVTGYNLWFETGATLSVTGGKVSMHSCRNMMVDHTNGNISLTDCTFTNAGIDQACIVSRADAGMGNLFNIWGGSLFDLDATLATVDPAAPTAPIYFRIDLSVMACPYIINNVTMPDHATIIGQLPPATNLNGIPVDTRSYSAP